jgi:hypothetical protein
MLRLSAIVTADDPEGLTGIPEKLLRCPRSSFSPFNQYRPNSLSLKPLPFIALETSRSITSIEKCRSFCAWAQKSHRRVGRKLSRAIPSDSNLSKINTGEYMRIFQNFSAVWAGGSACRFMKKAERKSF